MTKDVQSAFMSVLPHHKRAGNGFLNICCPSCGDTRYRGGFLPTATGGFRYRCFNGGCEFNDKSTGWEPGSGLGGRPRKLFSLLGGDIRDLPLDKLLVSPDSFVGNKRIAGGDLDIQTNFPSVDLPEGSIELSDIDPSTATTDQSAVVEYLFSRGEELACRNKFYWSPKYPRSLIMPYFHYGRTVGYLCRAIDQNAKKRFDGKSPNDYLFGQDKLEMGSARAMILLEGVMDAMALDAVAGRNSKLTKKQIALLNVCGQDIITLPDQERSGLAYIDTAEENGWYVSIPEWDPGVKDATAAAKRYGLLFAIESVVAGASKNYMKARLSLALREDK